MNIIPIMDVIYHQNHLFKWILVDQNYHIHSHHIHIINLVLVELGNDDHHMNLYIAEYNV